MHHAARYIGSPSCVHHQEFLGDWWLPPRQWPLWVHTLTASTPMLSAAPFHASGPDIDIVKANCASSAMFPGTPADNAFPLITEVYGRLPWYSPGQNGCVDPRSA